MSPHFDSVLKVRCKNFPAAFQTATGLGTIRFPGLVCKQTAPRANLQCPPWGIKKTAKRPQTIDLTNTTVSLRRETRDGKGGESHRLRWYTPCHLQTQLRKDATPFLISMQCMSPHALGRFYISFPGSARLQPGNELPGAPGSSLAMNSWERQAPAWRFPFSVFSVVLIFPLAVMESVEAVFAGLEPGAPRGVGKTSDFRTAKASFKLSLPASLLAGSAFLECVGIYITSSASVNHNGSKLPDGKRRQAARTPKFRISDCACLCVPHADRKDCFRFL